MSEDLRKCCRICLDMESDHVPILGDPTIYLQIKSCLSMTVSAGDGLPKSICQSCVVQLNDFYNFQLNARCTQDWLQLQLESEEQARNSNEPKGPIQPLPDSEYNSDSLLEFLNNNANIEEYLNNLGKEDIPSIVNILDRNQEKSSTGSPGKIVSNALNSTKQTSKAKEIVKTKIKIDVLDSEIKTVKEFLKKEAKPKSTVSISKIVEKQSHSLDQYTPPTKQKIQPITHIASTHKDQVMLQINGHFEPEILDNVYRCKQCSSTFKDRFLMYNHAKSHVMKEEEKFCDVCGQKVIGGEALSIHKAEAHGDLGDQKYRCKVCQFTTMDRKEIYMHVQKHCLVEEKEQSKHLCESCGRSFATKATLLRHVTTHSVTHNHNISQKPFNDIKSRDGHILCHVDMTMCEKCGYLSSCALEKHSCLRIM